MKRVIVPLLAVGALALGGCSTWESMSARDRATAIGAGVGGVAGHAVSDGGVIGTVGGAAAGGYIGREIQERRER